MKVSKMILVLLVAAGLLGQTKPAASAPATTKATTRPLSSLELKERQDDLAEASRRGILVSELQLERAQAKIVELQKQVADLQSQLKVATAQIETERKARQVAENTATAGQPVAKQDQQIPSEKKVFLSASEFNTLPQGTTTKKPLGFLWNVAVNSYGYLSVEHVVKVVDGSTVIVKAFLCDKTGESQASKYPNAADTDVAKEILIEVPTEGMADNTNVKIYNWFKIVGTQKYQGTTYFLAYPVYISPTTKPK